MSSKIRVLSESTINQIAAGEVIENPASVVKELVENALDAGASRVIVEISGGGHFMIRISDDGSGMTPDDALLAFERHATSKIVKVDDLWQIGSMGFRGEALASIAAVAKVDLYTATEKGVATNVVIHGGRVIQVNPCSRTQGTTIEITSLFYNTPVRKKFQKSQAASTTDIIRMMTRLALAHKHAAFTLISQEKLVLQTKGEERTREILGKEFMEGMKELSFQEDQHTLQGFISVPMHTRSTRAGQYLFINSRPIVSPLIAAAIKEAYGTRISSKDYPLFVLWLTMPPHLVDVNVHPQKREVRFCDEAMIAGLVQRAIKGLLAAGEGFQVRAPSFAPSYIAREEPGEPSRSYRASPPSYKAPGMELPEREPELQIPETESALDVYGIFQGFLLGELEGKCVIIDLAKAESRILFEQLLKRLRGEGAKDMQQLLFPETITFSLEESAALKDHLEMLNRLGIGIRSFGERCFIIESLAPYLPLERCRSLLENVLECGAVEEKIAKLASERGRKKSYEREEGRRMVRELLKCDDPYHCPSGKPTMVQMEAERLESLLCSG